MTFSIIAQSPRAGRGRNSYMPMLRKPSPRNLSGNTHLPIGILTIEYSEGASCRSQLLMGWPIHLVSLDT